MQNNVSVGLSEFRVSRDRDDVLVAYSLGSCVGFALWDPKVKVGGLAHIVLPSSAGPVMTGCGIGRGAALVVDESTPGKYADTAVPKLLARMREEGCDPKRLKAYMAGGAHVLRGLTWPGGDIGSANVKAVQEAAAKVGIEVLNSDVGENYGRTMRLYVLTGRVTVTSVGRVERDLQEE